MRDQKKYEILDLIGSGSFSQVHLGRNTDNNGLVILKILNAYRTKSINREIQILNNLKGSSNIV